MGVVLAATHLQLGERVAIKLLLSGAVADATARARFFREARAAAKIRSEHVARVYDIGTLESGEPFLVMEFLEGSDLDTRVRQRGPLPIHEAVEHILQACEAFAEAHSLGIIHRDIKPANLFVTARADGTPAVKVIDFGISKLTEPATSAGLAITKTTEVRGSPLFMSPEQLIATRDVDERSDIWSLGVSLFNLLTAAHPFPAQTLPVLYSRVLHGDPVPLRALLPDAPASLEATILRCLEKRAADRFASVAELAVALAEHAPPHARVSVGRAVRIRGESAFTSAMMAPPSRAVDSRSMPASTSPFTHAVAALSVEASRPLRSENGTPLDTATVPRLSRAAAAVGDGGDSPPTDCASQQSLADSWETTRPKLSSRRGLGIIAVFATLMIGSLVGVSVYFRMPVNEPSTTPSRAATSGVVMEKGATSAVSSPPSEPLPPAATAGAEGPGGARRTELSPVAPSLSSSAPAPLSKPSQKTATQTAARPVTATPKASASGRRSAPKQELFDTIP
jgi:serine/threonine-protein kinase